MPLENNRQVKTRLHIRNKNRERYDLNALTASNPELAKYIKPNKHGTESIDFANPVAVKILNKALLNHYYEISYWEFPDENLCPPIPGRADYMHHMADLLAENNMGKIPVGDKIICLDIGVGASCIYPIIGVVEYDWSFIVSDIDPKSIDSANKIADSNASLKGRIECRLQKDPKHIYQGIIGEDDKIDLSICNPPFHSTFEDAQKGSRRKVKNLSGQKDESPKRNFAGIRNELIYEGGEYQFITTMIRQSRQFLNNCYWFSTLVSKQSNLKGIYKSIEKSGATRIETIPMGTGNKSSRIVAWTFLSNEKQKIWRETRWGPQSSHSV